MMGWGRGANPGINDYPNEYYFGFSDTTDIAGMENLVASLTTTPEIQIERIQKREAEDWGSIRIIETDKHLQVSLENSKIHCTYSPVMTANLETAITELIIKKGIICVW
jgi:hypothetical protein